MLCYVWNGHKVFVQNTFFPLPVDEMVLGNPIAHKGRWGIAYTDILAAIGVLSTRMPDTSSGWFCPFRMVAVTRPECRLFFFLDLLTAKAIEST